MAVIAFSGTLKLELKQIRSLKEEKVVSSKSKKVKKSSPPTRWSVGQGFQRPLQRAPLQPCPGSPCQKARTVSAQRQLSYACTLRWMQI